jgi:hypothetical protein
VALRSVRAECEHVFVPRSPRFTRSQLGSSVASARSFSEVLRALGLRSAGGNFRTIRKYCELWEISTEHFDQAAVIREHLARRRLAATPLSEIMVAGSTYSRSHLKERLFAEGLKARACEMCGQGEEWRGGRLALILDHINGVGDDHRLPNLRVLCPNCAATLDTHCGRKNVVRRPPRPCAHCGESFKPKYEGHRFCSRACSWRWPRPAAARPELRRVERPPYEQLRAAVERDGWSAVGRRYGVSDNAVRKWMRRYERELAVGDGGPASGLSPSGAAGGVRPPTPGVLPGS